jgi:tRNA pseudouridine55 synthase
MPRKHKRPSLHGWLLLDKPQGLTSNQALGRVKFLFQCKKAGHAGTLDPLATGCLPIAFGEATKTVPFVVDDEKSYRFTVTWGSETDTDDSEGTVTGTSDMRPDVSAIQAALPGFVGQIEQIPPQYSAIKIDGQRAYDLAREGQTVAIAPAHCAGL